MASNQSADFISGSSLSIDFWMLGSYTDNTGSQSQLLAFPKALLLAALQGWAAGSLAIDVHPHSHYWGGPCHNPSSYPNPTLWALLHLVSNIFVKDLIYPAPCSFWLCTPPGFGAWNTSPWCPWLQHHIHCQREMLITRSRIQSAHWECPFSVWFVLSSPSAQSSLEHQH